jgi:hypothetical protein
LYQGKIIYLIDFGNIRFKNDPFFEKKDYTDYKNFQHHKLTIICNALKNNIDPWQEINKYSS